MGIDNNLKRKGDIMKTLKKTKFNNKEKKNLYGYESESWQFFTKCKWNGQPTGYTCVADNEFDCQLVGSKQCNERRR